MPGNQPSPEPCVTDFKDHTLQLSGTAYLGIRSFLPYLETVSSIRNLRVPRTMVARKCLELAIYIVLIACIMTRLRRLIQGVRSVQNNIIQ